MKLLGKYFKYQFHKLIYDEYKFFEEVDKEIVKIKRAGGHKDLDEHWYLSRDILNKHMINIEKNEFCADENIMYHSTILYNAFSILSDGELKVKDMFMNRVSVEYSTEYMNDGEMQVGGTFAESDMGKLFLSITPAYFYPTLTASLGNNMQGNVVTFCIDVSKLKDDLYKSVDFLKQDITFGRLETNYETKTEDMYKYIEKYLHGSIHTTEKIKEDVCEYYLKRNVNILDYVKRIYYCRNFDMNIMAEVDKDSDYWNVYKFDKVILPLVEKGELYKEWLKCSHNKK